MKNLFRNKPVLLVVAAFYLISCANNKRSENVKEEQPNIVFIFTDDQKWNTIHALGNDQIHTPNMDRMVDGAFVFNNAYCFGGNSGAVCIPSRNMVMSGKTFFRFEEDIEHMKARGEKPRKIHYTNPDWPTLPKAMKAAGYETYFREKSGSANNPVVRTQFDHYADIHQVNADAIGITRRQVKTVTYAFLYGAGDQKIGLSFDEHLTEKGAKAKGREIRDAYVKAIPGLDKLLEAVKTASTRGFIKSIDQHALSCIVHGCEQFILK